MDQWMYGYQLDQVFFGIPTSELSYTIFQVLVGERVQKFPAGHGADQIWEAKTAGTGARGKGRFFRFCCCGANPAGKGKKKFPPGVWGVLPYIFFLWGACDQICVLSVVYIWDDILPSYIEMILSHYEDLYWPTSIAVLNTAQVDGLRIPDISSLKIECHPGGNWHPGRDTWMSQEFSKWLVHGL